MPELNDSLAWLIADGAAFVMFFCLIFLSRNWRSWWLKWLVRLIPPVAMLLPIGVPGSQGFYAPAIIVAPFEKYLQEDGEPTNAIARLTLVVAALVGLISLAAVARWARTRSRTGVSD